jgi:outer membrane protein
MPIRMIIIISLLFSFNTFGSGTHGPLGKLAKDLLSNNSEVLSGDNDLEKAKIDIELHSADMNWALSYDYGFDDSKLENSFFFSSAPVETTSHSVGLSTSFYHGGTFSFSNNLTTAEGINSFTKINSKTHGFSQTIAYSIDLGANLFGRQNRLEREILNQKESLTEKKSSQIKDEQLLQLALGYTRARLAMTVETLDSEALMRSKKRESFVRKRVKDGLKLKVDLYQAEMSTGAQVEALATSKVTKESSFEKLGKLVHRPINKEDINPFIFENTEKETPAVSNLQLNNNLEIIKKRLNVIDSTIKIASLAKLPTIELSTAYVSNDYDLKSSTALSKGAIGSSTNAFQVGVNLTWSIGSEGARLKETSYIREKSLLERKKSNIENNITLSESMLKIRIETLNKNVESVKLRKVLARKALREYNNLYNKGRADLDSVIRAEEGLIGTEKTFVNYLAERDMACYQLSYLYGDIKRYITAE